MIAMSHVSLTEDEIAAATRVLQSGALRQGSECDAFELEFASKVGADYAITCSSGTAALHLAYSALLSSGDEVLCPAFTFIATASMICMAGGRPVFCDVDPETYLLDLDDAEGRVTARTKAIAPVHLFGNPCETDKVLAFAERHGLRIIWDAAQSHGAKIDGHDVGSLGDATCFSFYASKNLFIGEGGMVCTDDEELAHRLRLLRSHGQTGKYHHTMLGFNYRMSDPQAAIGRVQLGRLDEMLAFRRRNAALLNEALSEIAGLKPQRITSGAESAWHQYSLVVESESFGCDRTALADGLKAQGISTAVHYPHGLHQQPVFRARFGSSALPQSEYLSQNILSLPVHHGLSQSCCEKIVRAVRAAHEVTQGH